MENKLVIINLKHPVGEKKNMVQWSFSMWIYIYVGQTINWVLAPVKREFLFFYFFAVHSVVFYFIFVI